MYGSVYAGSRSQALLSSNSTFTGGVFQVVGNIPVGSTVRASALAKLFVAISSDLQGTYSQMRIGIDPNGGTNAYDGDVVWSGVLTSYSPAYLSADRMWTNYTQLSVEARATGNSVTLFLWGSQNWAAVEHRQFWDEASLIVVGSSGGTASSAPAPSTTSGGTVVESRVELNVRTGPGLSYSRIGTILPGATYAVVSQQPGWYGINYNGVTGYVSAYYVNVTQGQTSGAAQTAAPVGGDSRVFHRFPHGPATPRRGSAASRYGNRRSSRRSGDATGYRCVITVRLAGWQAGWDRQLQPYDRSAAIHY
jgi:uncharacterized protein YraI